MSSSQAGKGIGDRVVVFQPQQWGELVLVELFDADPDIVRQHEVEKDLLPAVELRADRVDDAVY